MHKALVVVPLLLLLVWMAAPARAQGRRRQLLDSGFYSRTCPAVQSTVANVIATHLKQDISSASALVRMFFHDCFVGGCDASFMILSTPDNTAERDAVPNLTLRQFNIINEIKFRMEQICPGVVSCADIVALAAKEAVVQSGGPDWTVELGRRDGRRSTADDAAAHLPSSLLNAESLIEIFAANGFTIRDLVTLSGAHTFGRAHCFQIARRFYNFNSSFDIDPTLDGIYAQKLKRLCPQPIVSETRILLEPITPNTFDAQYYLNLLQNKGMFTSDSALLFDDRTKVIVQEYADNPQSFFTQFPLSMIKMGRLNVLTGTQGEIRKRCAAINRI